jgi:glycosyltransferase involved in cell wall biosynthesis
LANISSKEPLVSVAIQTFNHRNYLKDCLEGILCQKVDFKFEILLRDDASTDGTAEIAEMYASKYPKVINLLAYAENQYINGVKPFLDNVKRAKGKYVAFCEGDDYWTDPYKLQKQVDLLEENKEYVLSFHKSTPISKEGIILRESYNDSHYENMAKGDMIKPKSFPTLTVCFRNVLEKLPDDLMSKAPNGDTFLYSFLGNYGKAKYQADILPAHYRVHEGGVHSMKSSSKKNEMSVKTFKQLAKYYQHLGKLKYEKYYSDAAKLMEKRMCFFRELESKNRIQGFVKGLDWILADLWLRGKIFSTSKQVMKSIFR